MFSEKYDHLFAMYGGPAGSNSLKQPFGGVNSHGRKEWSPVADLLRVNR